eukprot:gnl/TRDRNA2_/TRDRNA2_36304_c0_seq1.p1 gnl/TRDRNA2_/TRDRNA2_36304_c0~~gnl/TRDRNA2_/TRDRNA2_36304_c0_seq1.p1  ORF type:complete len:1021 (-),score=200.66 gnl/TRDRNA2_/TRDRNA2_36304_c0_seq1:71-2866(-)
MRANATFVGYPAMEELPVRIVYVDPVHDFAILRFNPSQLEQTPHVEIELDPAGCRVGEEIRIMGNDSLEKLQILSGTIARVDRNAPDLDGDYQDENTFYAIAGSGTRGGSSGSPVLSHQGRCVALNAAAVCGTMHGLFLPLHRVARALEAVRGGAPVPRGTVGAALSFISFPEALRLGITKKYLHQHVLGQEPEPGGTHSEASPAGGMLKVQRCIPGTAADKLLQPGDILLELQGRPCADFVFFDACLDESVGGCVKLTISRMGRHLELELPVQDLHDLVPHEFIELGLGIFHQVPYQTAQKHHIPLEGIYVAQAGFVFGEAVKTDAVILSINGIPCRNLQTFEETLRKIPDKEYFSVSWMLPRGSKERRRHESFVKMQRQWWPFRYWTLDRANHAWSPRVDATGTDLGKAVGEPEEAEADAEDEVEMEAEVDSSAEPPAKRARTVAVPATVATPVKSAAPSKFVEVLSQCLCSVLFRAVQHFDMDLVIDRSNLESDVVMNRGTGIILDAEAGLVLTDRGTVPQALGDIEVMLGDESRGASVMFIHPVHSLVVLRLDEPQRSFGKAAKFADAGLQAGAQSNFVGVDSNGELFTAEVKIQGSRLADFPAHWPLRWRQQNLEAVCLTEEPPGGNNGVLASSEGCIHALYALSTVIDQGEAIRTGYCVPVYAMMPFLELLRSKTTVPVVPSLEVTLQSMALQKLRRLPARLRPSAEWLRQLGARGKSALQIAGVAAGGSLAGHASEGDLLVAVCGEVVASARSVEAVLQRRAREAAGNDPVGGPLQVELTLLSHGKERRVNTAVPLLGSDGTDRLLVWNGLVLREVPRHVKGFAETLPAGIHISNTMLGSPAEASQLEGDIIVGVNDIPTTSLKDLFMVDREADKERRYMRVESVALSGQKFVTILQTDPLFWPTLEIAQDRFGAWSCAEVSAC